MNVARAVTPGEATAAAMAAVAACVAALSIRATGVALAARASARLAVAGVAVPAGARRFAGRLVGDADDANVRQVFGIHQARPARQQSADGQDRPEKGLIEFHG